MQAVILYDRLIACEAPRSKHCAPHRVVRAGHVVLETRGSHVVSKTRRPHVVSKTRRPHVVSKTRRPHVVSKTRGARCPPPVRIQSILSRGRYYTISGWRRWSAMIIARIDHIQKGKRRNSLSGRCFQGCKSGCGLILAGLWIRNRRQSRRFCKADFWAGGAAVIAAFDGRLNISVAPARPCVFAAAAGPTRGWPAPRDIWQRYGAQYQCRPLSVFRRACRPTAPSWRFQRRSTA